MIFWFLCASVSASTVVEWTFDDGEEGFTSQSGLQWQWGADASGRWGWSTRTNSLYLNDASDSLSVPSVDLSGTIRPVLGLQHEYDIDQTGPGDGGWLEVYLDDEWSIMEPVYGYPDSSGFAGISDGVQWDWFDLSEMGETPEVRLVFTSDDAVRRTGWFIDNITIEDGDPVPPIFQRVDLLSDTTDVEGPYVVTATIVDDLEVAWADIHWQSNNGESGSSPLTRGSDDEYEGGIAGQDPGTVIEWWLEAFDGSNRTRWPVDDNNRFSVRLPAPADLQTRPETPNGRLAATTVDLHWSPPDGEHTMAGYVVERDGIQVATPTETNATIALVDGLQELSVRGVFRIGEQEFVGDSCPPLKLDVSLPSLHTVTPNNAWPDDNLRVTISGDNLYMDADSTSLESVDGIEIQNFEVLDANTARGLIYVEPDAEPGPRMLQLDIDGMLVASDGLFLIQSAGERPTILGAHPTSVRQGAHTSVFIDMSSPVETSRQPPSVNLGEGIIVENVLRRGSGLDVQLSVAHDAPLGEHPIEVDEGDRLITGASLEVRDTPKIPERNCSATGHPRSTSWGWLFGVLVFIFRRKHSG